MKISNKVESYNKIIELGLNHFPERIFNSSQINEVEDFIKSKGCMEDGHASERVVDLIENIVNGTNKN